MRKPARSSLRSWPASRLRLTCDVGHEKMKLLSTILPMLVLIGGQSLAQSLPATTASAPPLRHGPSTETHDLGSWDDVFVCSDQDVVLLRRESDLFALPMTGSTNPLKLVSSPALVDTRIVTCAGSGDKLWVFLQSERRVPSAFEVRSGTMVEFKAPGLRVAGNQAPEIQSHVIIRHADAAILMIARGDPVMYFWMSLRSGKVVCFPTGWDLAYFSADQQLAVFEKPQVKEFERRPLQAIDVRTGEAVSEVPDLQRTSVVKFNWTEIQPVKALYAKRAETGDRDYLAGLSINGLVLPFGLDMGGASWMSVARTKVEFAGFRLQRDGASAAEPNSFWIAALAGGQKPELVATGVTDFVMLGEGNCVFCSPGHDRKDLSSEAWFHSRRDKSAWNVLADVDRLPELDKKYADRPYIEDKMSVRLIDGFGGNASNSLALCLCIHFRGDMRAVLPIPDAPLKPTTWRCGIIITTDGQRYMTDLFRDGDLPDQVWLHNSGRVLTGRYLWESFGSRKTRRLQLSVTTVRLQEKPKGTK